MSPDRTDDGRWILVDGRRWRASDPSIPDTFRQELVDELMDARREVGHAKRAGEDEAVSAARRRVDDAKHALGERGRAWWEEPTVESTTERLRATILALARHRAPKTICPSDAARTAGGDGWRSLMDDTRRVAAALARDGQVEITQRGELVQIDQVKGPVRIRLVAPGDDPVRPA